MTSSLAWPLRGLKLSLKTVAHICKHNKHFLKHNIFLEHNKHFSKHNTVLTKHNKGLIYGNTTQ